MLFQFTQLTGLEQFYKSNRQLWSVRSAYGLADSSVSAIYEKQSGKDVKQQQTGMLFSRLSE